MYAKMIMAVIGMMISSAVAAQTDNDKLTNFQDTTFMLKEVTVKSSLPQTRVKGDAMRTLVSGTSLEKVGTCTDVLNRIPQLKAEKDGGVEVFGRGGAEVYINGRRVMDMKELSRIRSEQVKSIDVVQNPGARYAASTKAVVRIQLKKAQGEGISFIEDLSGNYRYGNSLYNNLDVNYRTGGLDVTASMWAGIDYSGKSLQENELTYYVGPDFYKGISRQDSKVQWKGWSPQIQVNYMINENHSLGAFYKYDRRPWSKYAGWLATDTYENGKLLEKSVSDLSQNETFTKHIFNAYYNGKVGKLSIDLNIDGQFDKDNDPNSTVERTTKVDGTESVVSVNNVTDSKNRFWASKLIFSYPVLNGNLSLGGEYSHNNRTDVYSYTFENTRAMPMKATDTNIKESATSAFVEYGRRFGRLFAQVGMRYEYLNTEYYDFGKKQNDVSRSYGDWFPTATLAMPVGKTQLSLSYRRDIQRPEYSRLTSSTVYINKYTYQTGNPYLRPTYTSSLVFNAAYKAFNFMVNYAHTKDVVTLLTEPYPGSEDPLINILHPVNSPNGYDKITINPSFRPTIGKWHPMWSVGMIIQNFKTPTADGTEITLNHPFFQIMWQNDIELPQGFRLNAYAALMTKGDYDNFRMSTNTLNTGLGLQRDFSLKQLGTLTADFRCYDIFNTAKTGVTVFGVRELTAENPARRTFSFNLTWKFNEARSKYRGTGAGKSQKARL